MFIPFTTPEMRTKLSVVNELNREIDDAVEFESSIFWKNINNRRKSKSLSVGSEVEFNGQICRDPQQIVTGCGNIFKIYILILKESILTHNLKASRSSNARHTEWVISVLFRS